MARQSCCSTTDTSRGWAATVTPPAAASDVSARSSPRHTDSGPPAPAAASASSVCPAPAPCPGTTTATLLAAAPPCVVRDANMGHQLAGGNSS